MSTIFLIHHLSNVFDYFGIKKLDEQGEEIEKWLFHDLHMDYSLGLKMCYVNHLVHLWIKIFIVNYIRQLLIVYFDIWWQDEVNAVNINSCTHCQLCMQVRKAKCIDWYNFYYAVFKSVPFMSSSSCLRMHERLWSCSWVYDWLIW